MTALSAQSALDIFASHGADPARWPEDQRAALLALAASDAAVAAALADARAIDAAVADWLHAPPPPLALDVAAITRQPQQRPLLPAARPWRPAALAASLALMVAAGGWLGLSTRSGNGAPTIAAATPPSAGVELAEADAAFAYVFTPTAAEEELI